MRSKIIMIGLCILAFAGIGTAQQKNISLTEALKSAEQHYPSLKQKPLLEARSAEMLKIFHNALFPIVNVTGQATFQNEVTTFDFPGLPAGFGPKKDNYNLGLDIRLPLTQAGTLQTRKQIELAQTALGFSQIDQEVQRLRETITNLFGNILLQKENEKILAIRLIDLDKRAKKIAVEVNNGAMLKSNLLMLESEMLTAQQRREDLSAVILSLTKQLALFTDLPIDTSTVLQFSDIETVSQAINRPETRVFEAQRSILDLRSALLKKENLPNIYLFTQGFLGRPGYNFLNNNLRPYGLAGIGVNWNLNNRYNQSGQQRILDLNKQIVNSQEEVFNQNLQAALTDKAVEISKYQNIFEKDNQIVKNWQETVQIIANQLDNGAITATEYLTALNALNTAQLNLLLHRVQLSIAKAQYKAIAGE